MPWITGEWKKRNQAESQAAWESEGMKAAAGIDQVVPQGEAPELAVLSPKVTLTGKKSREIASLWSKDTDLPIKIQKVRALRFKWGLLNPQTAFFQQIFIYLFNFISELHPQHMEVPRLGVESELQLPAYPTATATRDLNGIFDLYHSSQQHQIPNPLSKAKDWISIPMATTQIRFCWVMTGTPQQTLRKQLWRPSHSAQGRSVKPEDTVPALKQFTVQRERYRPKQSRSHLLWHRQSRHLPNQSLNICCLEGAS